MKLNFKKTLLKALPAYHVFHKVTKGSYIMPFHKKFGMTPEWKKIEIGH